MKQAADASASLNVETLEQLRTRLLDLTGRNRLLNFHHPKKSSLRVIDELPNQIVATLLSGEEMQFSAVPEPTEDDLVNAGYLSRDTRTGNLARLREPPGAKEWAEHIGLATSYEVPTVSDSVGYGKHSDKVIQTLFYPFELEARLKALRQASESAIQEMGTNILYLAVGFLEWYESKDSEAAHLAPLMLVPVALHKGRLNEDTRTYEYTVTHSSEDLLTNLSLREKLRVDFSMALPDLDESTTPEDYLRSVHDLIDKLQPRWRVRRYISLALFNFSKLLMYLDLDPGSWPTERDISNHPVVSQILLRRSTRDVGCDVGAESLGFGEEYAIDGIESVPAKYPLIDDADSSQHSALIDAVDGKNLVIEGPPGTGKSQTITNLIAAVIAQGKTVLFVAEKLAALQVVRNKLDAAGLGEFCLELHSNKAQKHKLIDDIKERIGRHGQHPLPRDIDADVARFEELKVELGSYAEKLNQPWKNTGRTLHEVFAAATRYRNAIRINLDAIRPEGCTGEGHDPSAQRRCRDRADAYQQACRAVVRELGDRGAFQNHPWFGVSNVELQIFDVTRVSKCLGEWQEALLALAKQRQTLARTLGCVGGAVASSAEDLQALLAQLEDVPELCGDEILEAIPALRGERLDDVSSWRDSFAEIQGMYRALANEPGAKVLQDLSRVDQIRAASETISRLVNSSVTLEELSGTVRKLGSVNDELSALQQPLTGLRTSLGDTAEGILTFSPTGLLECKTAIELVADLRQAYWEMRDPLFQEEELDKVLPELRVEVVALNRLEAILGDTFSMETALDERELREIEERLASGGALRWFKASWRRERKRLLSHAASPRVKLKEMEALLGDAIVFARNQSKLESNRVYKESLSQYFRGKETDLDALEALRTWYKAVRQNYGSGFGKRAALGDTILNLPARSAGVIRVLARRGAPQQLQSLVVTWAGIRQAFTVAARVESNDTVLFGEVGVIPELLRQLHHAMDICRPLADDDTRSIADLCAQTRELSELQAKVSRWRNADFGNKYFGGRIVLSLGADADNEQSLAVLDHTLQLAKYCDHKLSNSQLASYVYRAPTAATFVTLSERASSLHAAADAEAKGRKAYATLVDLDATAWQANADGTLEGLIGRNQRALTNAASLQGWLDYIRVRGQLVASGFGRVASAVEGSTLAVDEVRDACQAGVFDSLARQALREDPKLARFSGASHDVLRQQFVKYDNQLKQLQRQKIAHAVDHNRPPAGVMSARVGDLTEGALLEHECSKQKRHIPLRQLLRRAGRALLALKPCFMMGPMSVAQYLAPGTISFDLVVMDEASQIKPEDAIGAVARGGQLVVVGDPNQLPPTNFFERLADDGDDDPTGSADAESILDAVWPLFQRRLLRWHYRSQHPDLIAFSNEFFYKDLVLFPSPYDRADGYGLHYHRQPRGCFVSHRNMEEARVIADAVRKHFQVRPEDTLGVACMNVEQRTQLEAAIEALAKDDAAFQAALDKDAERRESLFIKNLENVQGDERDVMFISMTYGPSEPNGKVMQRFGPINSETGWRRLNVLFTRARKRMDIFSSMGSGDIVIAQSSKRGVKALHDFLGYCETGILSRTEGPTGRPPDSDFEVAVMDVLRRRGFDCVPQVGVAGFFIDAAVTDPGRPGHYLMGIECDGASYHSAKSTRDRDRLRQSILERLGWRIRRIWSTDWYKNPSAALAPILEELDGLKSETSLASAAAEEDADPGFVFKESTPTTDETRTDAIAYEGGNLRDKLVRFRDEVIRKEVPDTPESKRLLRPAMLEALLEFQPANRVEFLEQIPRYLREGTAVNEAKYLDQVFEIVNASLERV